MKRFVLLSALAFFPPAISAQDYGTEKAPPVPKISVPLTPEQKAALHAIGVRMSGFEALIPKIDDAKYKKSIVSELQDLKKRHAALEKNFDPGLNEALMHSVISRYQAVALWLTPVRLSPPGAKAPATSESAGPAETKAATKAVTK